MIDVETKEIVAHDLKMPHSPRIYNDQIYLLQAAEGSLIKVDVSNGQTSTIFQKEGFARGLCKHEDYLFIGYSKIRKNSSSFGKLNFSSQANHCGISIIHEPSGALVGELQYVTSVDEIYDIQIIPDCHRPNILRPDAQNAFSGLITPNSSYWGQSE